MPPALRPSRMCIRHRHTRAIPCSSGYTQCAVTWTQSVRTFKRVCFWRIQEVGYAADRAHTPVTVLFLTTFATSRENTLGRVAELQTHKELKRQGAQGPTTRPRRPPTGAHEPLSQPLTPASASSTRWRDPAWPAAAARVSSPWRARARGTGYG